MLDVPVVFVANKVSQREQGYRDLLDQTYEYPNSWRQRVREGDRFLYYRGTKDGGPAGYFGTGLVGPIGDSDLPGRKRCEVLDVVLFDDLVPLKDPDSGEYHEPPGVNQLGFQQGVRVIASGTYARILELAAAPPMDPSAGNKSPSSLGYPGDPAARTASELYAVDRVLERLQQEFPAEPIDVMPRNNPGFDIQVRHGDLLYVEVKGTVGKDIAFFMSEGERRFSVDQADRYRLYVVYDIHLTDLTHKVFVHQGAVSHHAFTIEPRQYRMLATPAAQDIPSS